MESMRLWLHAPVEHAVRVGVARHGFDVYELSNEDLAGIPSELHDELSLWVRRCAKGAREGKGFDPKLSLELDRPEVSLSAVIDALRRSFAQRRDARVNEILKLWGDDFKKAVFGTIYVYGEPLSDIRSLMNDHPELRKRVDREIESERAVREQEAAAVRALREYASSIPELSRAAAEKYPVEGPTIRHIADAIVAGLDDAEVLEEPFKSASEMVTCKVPSASSFAMVDAAREHVKSLNLPTGIEVTVGPVKLMKRAYGLDDYSSDFGRSEPMAVVPIWVKAGSWQELVVMLGEPVDERAYAGGYKYDEEVPF